MEYTGFEQVEGNPFLGKKSTPLNKNFLIKKQILTIATQADRYSVLTGLFSHLHDMIINTRNCIRLEITDKSCTIGLIVSRKIKYDRSPGCSRSDVCSRHTDRLFISGTLPVQ